MKFVPADPVSVALFSLLAVAMAAAIVWSVDQLKFGTKRIVAALGSYLILYCGIVFSGLPARSVLPWYPLLFISVLGTALGFGLSRYGQRMAESRSFAFLISAQGFRLPLELILHHWANLGTIPNTMTWTGQNWDVLSGIISLLAIPFVNRSKAMAWVVQSLSFGLLLNVLRVVILSSPLPASWQLDNPVQLIAHMPYSLIGPLFVGPALALHIITFRKLLRC